MDRIYFVAGLFCCLAFGLTDKLCGQVRLLRKDAPAAARVSVVGSDDKPYAPTGAALRQTKRGESYFYADGLFDVELPPGRARLATRPEVTGSSATLKMTGIVVVAALTAGTVGELAKITAT